MLNELVQRVKIPLRRVKRFYREQLVERAELSRLRSAVRQVEESQLRPVSGLKKFFFNTQYPTFYCWIEYLIAQRLRRRGHGVKFLICDGVGYCEQETVTFKRPPCASCSKRIKRHMNAFSFEYETVNSLLTLQDRTEARKLAYGESISKLQKHVAHGIPIGEISSRNLVHYYKGNFEITGEVERQYRRMFESAYLVMAATVRYFEKNKTDVVVSTNGKFIQSGIAIDYAKALKKDYITWEVFNQFTSTLFAKNSLALEQRIDEAWEKEKDIPLKDDQRSKLYKNFAAQAKSENTPFRYHESHYEASKEGIIKRFNLNLANPVIVMFPNVEWDSTAMIESGFSSMLDWLNCGIEYAIKNPAYQVIVRAHPGELKVPYDLKTRSPICDRIRELHPNLPKNVHLVGPLDEVSSYAIADLANVVMIFASTLGIEFALKRIKPWVAARNYYYGKGFTVDLKGKDDMYRRLDEKQFNLQLTEHEHADAERFAYMVRYRFLFSFPYFANGKFQMRQYCQELEKNEPVVENICDFVEGKRGHLDLGKANW